MTQRQKPLSADDTKTEANPASVLVSMLSADNDTKTEANPASVLVSMLSADNDTKTEAIVCW